MRERGEWYRRKLEDNRSNGSRHRVVHHEKVPEQLHGMLSAASAESNRVPPLVDFTGQVTDEH